MEKLIKKDEPKHWTAAKDNHTVTHKDNAFTVVEDLDDNMLVDVSCSCEGFTGWRLSLCMDWRGVKCNSCGQEITISNNGTKQMMYSE